MNGDCYGENLDDLTADDWPIPAVDMIAVFEFQILSTGLSRLSNVFYCGKFYFVAADCFVTKDAGCGGCFLPNHLLR